ERRGAFHGDQDRRNQHHQVQDQQEVVALFVESPHLEHQRDDRHYQNEAQGHQGIPDRSAQVDQHHGDDQQRQASQQLVGGAEQGPDQHAAGAIRATGAKRQQQTGCDGQYGRRQAFLHPRDVVDITPLLEDVALQAQAGIHGGTSKERSHYRQHGGRQYIGYPHGVGNDVGTALHE